MCFVCLFYLSGMFSIWHKKIGLFKSGHFCYKCLVLAQQPNSQQEPSRSLMFGSMAYNLSPWRQSGDANRPSYRSVER